MKPILEIQHISKKFMIQREQQPYLSLRDAFSSLFKSAKSKKNEFWALNDISFDVYPGDSVGIIGKNGAGKSTLLKILSKITPPTSGKIVSRGRIASLLEVGTGFHAELSGRENIFMNGSILGMRKQEILKNFDAIVDFAGVEKFIDTPLKHYSSGMQLRLAFAVAAFLENEILIIDEVLAVGDADFQKKCMGKMKDVSNSGRTVLFVSHNIGALRNLCSVGALLSQGKLKNFGDLNLILDQYSDIQDHLIGNFLPENRVGIKEFMVENITISPDSVRMGKKFSVAFQFNKKVNLDKMDLDFRIDTIDSEKCLWISTKQVDKNKFTQDETNTICFEFEHLYLNAGIYTITHCLYVRGVIHDNVQSGFCFEVLEDNFFENWFLPPKSESNFIAKFNILLS